MFTWLLITACLYVEEECSETVGCMTRGKACKRVVTSRGSEKESTEGDACKNSWRMIERSGRN